jgi:hypothetical protein
VTFPSRAFGAGEMRRFFDYVRAADGTADAVKRLKEWIVEQYKARGGTEGAA